MTFGQELKETCAKARQSIQDGYLKKHYLSTKKFLKERAKRGKADIYYSELARHLDVTADCDLFGVILAKLRTEGVKCSFENSQIYWV